MRASRFLVYNINYFINKGGLDAMVARVTNTDPHLSVPLIKLHIMAWHKAHTYLLKK
jgi:hypothetical protein